MTVTVISKIDDFYNWIMMFSLKQLAEIIGAVGFEAWGHLGDKECLGIGTDTRQIQPGEVFLALKGENFDGHDFLDLAVAKGAIALITESPLDTPPSPEIPQLRVKNTLEAYQKIAHYWRNQFTIPVIGVTGSVGKTTTKELIAAVLSTQGKVLKTEANYNNEIGVPKTLLSLTSDHDYAIIEMAMRGRGEIALLTQIARPTIGLITNVGTAHIGRLGSEQAIAEAKCELLAQMSPSGIAILNHDNERLINTAKTVWQGETITYGLEGGDLQGKIIDHQFLEVAGMTFPLPLAGRHNALNYLAALAIAKVLELDWQLLTKGLTVNLPGGRSRRYQLDQDLLLLDETYNAGLESMLAALAMLKETPGKRHIAVLGTMKELGEHSVKLHRQVGEMAEKLGLDHLLVLTSDPEATAILEGTTTINTESLASHQGILDRLKEIVQPGDRILFKASNSIGLNRVVEDFVKSHQVQI
jgi:UDP-N-acetylmuramoyl-tripeptide--D-alanyl-D-alanine ligase